MLNVSRHGLGADRPDRDGLRPPTLLVVAALHIAVLCAAGLLFHARQTTPPPAGMTIPVVFVPDAAASLDRSPQMLASRSLPAPSTAEPAALAPLPTLNLTLNQAGPLSQSPPLRLRREQSYATSTRDTHTLAAQAMPAAAAPIAAAPAARQVPARAAATLPSHAMAGWEAQIRQAVQDAAIYPAAARLLHRHGSAQIRFDYNLGAVQNASVAQTSHFDILDHAALAAVTRAAIPDPPAELGPQRRTMLVWVQFQLVSEE